MSIRYWLFGGAAMLAVTACAGQAGAAQAADTAADQAAASSGVSEVVVTARKRSENVQRIPIAVVAASGIQMQQRGIRQPSDLERLVPSLTINGNYTSNPTGAAYSIRGQAPGDNLLTTGIPVGLYEDFVNIPHSDGSNLAFFDIQRVEVLEGPQGTLYGRNTTGGAVDVITRGADYDGYHGFVNVEGGNHADWKLAGAANVPLIDQTLAMRLAYQHWNRDGYGHSAITGQKFGGDRDDDVARLSLKYTPVSNFTATAKAEYFRAHRSNSMFTTRELNTSSVASLNTEVMVEAAQLGRPSLLAFGLPSALVNGRPNVYDPNQDLFTNYSDNIDYDRIDGWHSALDMTWNISDDIALRSITGYHEFTDFRAYDYDNLPGQLLQLVGGTVPIAAANNATTVGVFPAQQDRSITQEFDLSGKAIDSRLNWLVGAYVQDDNGDSDDQNFVLPALSQAATGHSNVAANYHTINQHQKLWGLYTQNDFKFTDWFSITGGLRYSEEQLSMLESNYSYNTTTAAIANRYTCSVGPSQPIIVPAADAPSRAPPTPAFASEAACEYGAGAKFSGLSYLASLNFQLTPDTLLYLKTAKGFRGGALQPRATGSNDYIGPPGGVVAYGSPNVIYTPPGIVKPETATDYEVGLKADWFERRLRTNLDYYHTDYTNKQESRIIQNPDGLSIHSELFNAAKARIDGVESTITAIPIENLTLTSNASWFQGVYSSFSGAPGLNGAPTFDASGVAFSTPTWNIDIGGRYVVPRLGPGDLGISADYFWTSKTHTTKLNDYTQGNPLTAINPQLQQELYRAIGIVNLSVDYTIPSEGLTIRAFATNLLDLHYSNYNVINIAFLGYVTTTQEPRFFGVQVTKTFGHE